MRIRDRTILVKGRFDEELVSDFVVGSNRHSRLPVRGNLRAVCFVVSTDAVIGQDDTLVHDTTIWILCPAAGRATKCRVSESLQRWPPEFPTEPAISAGLVPQSAPINGSAPSLAVATRRISLPHRLTTLANSCTVRALNDIEFDSRV